MLTYICPWIAYAVNQHVLRQTTTLFQLLLRLPRCTYIHMRRWHGGYTSFLQTVHPHARSQKHHSDCCLLPNTG